MKWTKKKYKDKPKCPECGKRKLEIKISTRKNYFYGNKSYPRHTAKKLVHICTNERLVVIKKDDGTKIEKRDPCKYMEVIATSPPRRYIHMDGEVTL